MWIYFLFFWSFSAPRKPSTGTAGPGVTGNAGPPTPVLGAPLGGAARGVAAERLGPRAKQIRALLGEPLELGPGSSEARPASPPPRGDWRSPSGHHHMEAEVLTGGGKRFVWTLDPSSHPPSGFCLRTPGGSSGSPQVGISSGVTCREGNVMFIIFG